MGKKEKPASKKTVATFEKSEFWVRVDKDGNQIGEPQEVNVLVKQISRNDFMITYLSALVGLIDNLGNKKMKVVKYILQNMDKSTNKLTETTTEIATGAGVSRVVVSETLKILENANFIARKTGVVMLSPKIAHRGSAAKENMLLTKFHMMRDEHAPIAEKKESPTGEVEDS